MIIPLILMTLVPLFALSYLQAPPEEIIVGVWKHHKDDVFFVFFHDGSMKFKIPFTQGDYEIPGKYELMDRNLLNIELDHQYGSISGEQIFTNPRILKVTIHVNEIIFHGLKINESEEQKFIRIK
jgi:hypothetical protein